MNSLLINTATRPVADSSAFGDASTKGKRIARRQHSDPLTKGTGRVYTLRSDRTEHKKADEMNAEKVERSTIPETVTNHASGYNKFLTDISFSAVRTRAGLKLDGSEHKLDTAWGDHTKFTGFEDLHKELTALGAGVKEVKRLNDAHEILDKAVANNVFDAKNLTEEQQNQIRGILKELREGSVTHQENIAKVASKTGDIEASTKEVLSQLFEFLHASPQELTAMGLKPTPPKGASELQKQLEAMGVTFKDGKIEFPHKMGWQGWVSLITGIGGVLFGVFNSFGVSAANQQILKTQQQTQGMLSQLVPVLQQLADQNNALAAVVATLKASRDKLASLLGGMADSIVNNLSPTPMKVSALNSNKISKATVMNFTGSAARNGGAQTLNFNGASPTDGSTSTTDGGGDDDKKKAQQSGAAPTDAQLEAKVKAAQAALVNYKQQQALAAAQPAPQTAPAPATPTVPPGYISVADFLAFISKNQQAPMAGAPGVVPGTPSMPPGFQPYPNPSVYTIPSAQGQTIMPIRQG